MTVSDIFTAICGAVIGATFLLNRLNKLKTEWNKLTKAKKKRGEPSGQNQAEVPEQPIPGKKHVFVILLEIMFFISIYLGIFIGKNMPMTVRDGAFYTLIIVTYISMQQPENRL